MNQQGVFSSTTNTPLTPEGVEQCRAAGQSLKGAGIDCIVTSPLERAQHSARIVAEELGLDPSRIVVIEEFQERHFGPLEGTPYRQNVGMDNIPGVEHSTELIARVDRGLARLKTLEANTILVVSHGAVGRALRHLVNPSIPYKGSAKFANAQPEQLL